MYRDVVFLLPGFLGFDRIGSFYYFADRVAASIRATLETRHGRAVPVVPLQTEPTAPLADRQATLVTQIRATLSNSRALERVEHIHLVGHSTGGVDALLLGRVSLGGGTWDDANHAIPPLRSIVTLGSKFNDDSFYLMCRRIAEALNIP